MTRNDHGPLAPQRTAGKAPAFQLYARDFLGDQKTMLMTTEHIGALFMLLMSCWEGDGIPHRIDDLAAIARMDTTSFGIAWRKRLRVCFIKHPTKPGYLTHKRLDAQRRSHEELREKRTAAINTRWDRVKALNDTATKVEPQAEYTHDTCVSDLNADRSSLQAADCDLHPAQQRLESTSSLRFAAGSRKRNAVSSTPAKAVLPAWLAPFSDAFLALSPKARPDFWQWSAILKPLVDDHGSADVQGEWTNYLQGLDDLKRLSPRWFATHYGTWSQPRRTDSSENRGGLTSESLDDYLASFSGGSD